jgi:hypothetical protein
MRAYGCGPTATRCSSTCWCSWSIGRGGAGEHAARPLPLRPGLGGHARGRDRRPLPWASPSRAPRLQAFATGASFAGVMGAMLRGQAELRQPRVLHPAPVDHHPLHGHPRRHGLAARRGRRGDAAVTLLNLEVLKSFSQFLNELRQAGSRSSTSASGSTIWPTCPRQLEPAKYERMIFGLILILMMIFRPQRHDPRAPPPSSRLEDGMSGPLLAVRTSPRRFGGLRALGGVSLHGGGGCDPLHHRPQRRGQDHALQRAHGRVPARPGRCCCEGRADPGSRPTASPASASPAPSRTSASSAR